MLDRIVIVVQLNNLLIIIDSHLLLYEALDVKIGAYSSLANSLSVVCDKFPPTERLAIRALGVCGDGLRWRASPLKMAVR